MVARGASSAGPVLLACRQWDPHGLARKLPSPEAGAWTYAPLLPWQVQCPGRVCAALATGSRGLGPVPGVVSSLFPPARPACPALCVGGRPVWVSLNLARWYAIPCGLCVPRARSGCPSGFPRVSFVCVCACALATSAPPPPSPGWCGACTSRSPSAGRWEGRSTRSVPLRVSGLGPMLRLACLGGGDPVPFPPTWLGAARSPWGGCGRGDASPTPPHAL